MPPIRRPLALLACAALAACSCHRNATPFPTAAGDLARERAAAKQMGLPLTPGEMQAPLPPADQNAAPLYTQLTRLLTTKPLSKADDASLAAVARLKRSSPAQQAAVRRLFAARPEILPLIHKSAQRPQCVFVRDWSKGLDLLFPEFPKMRIALRCLNAESLFLLQDGKPLDAVRNQALGFRIARHAAADPTLIGYLVAVALDSITLAGMQRFLYQAGDSPSVADAVRQAIEQNWQPHSLTHALRGEVELGVIICDRLRTDGPNAYSGDERIKTVAQNALASKIEDPAYWNAWVDASEAYFLSQVRRVIAAAEHLFPKADAAFKTMRADIAKDSDQTHALSNILFPVYDQAASKGASAQAQADVTRSAAAVLAWKDRHGAFPKTLNDAISPVPIDPFDGRLLRYRQVGGGFVIYSVGATGKFDGGAPNVKPPAAETVFHYPMPAYLK
jgi:hypothetical protein